MKTNLTATEKKLIEKIAYKSRMKADDWFINHLYEEYQRAYQRPFNG